MADADRVEIERAAALATLERWQERPLTLRRPVYFVPGWTDESGESAWYRMSRWVPEVCANAATRAWFVRFVRDRGTGPPEHEDFVRFGIDLARLVSADPAVATEGVDFVCHSMGGLDALAAIGLLEERPEERVAPVRGTRNLVALDTPFRGFAAARNRLLGSIANARRQGDLAVASQLAAMRADSLRIAQVWRARNRFLGSVEAFWPRGADNWSGLIEVPHESASFGGPADFDESLRPRYRGYRSWPGTSHSGKAAGVTNDLRAVVEVLEILAG
jgi:hypothetical protein